MSPEELAHKLDSVKALEIKEKLALQGINLEDSDNPLKQFYDSLDIQTLPISYTEDYVNFLPSFKPVPKEIASYLDFEGHSPKAITLPESVGARLLLLAADEVEHKYSLWLYSLDDEYIPVDKLCLYAIEDESDVDINPENFIQYFSIIDLNKVNHVLITHDHTDHIKSVGSFSHDYKVPVYATKLVHMGIESNYCITRKVAPDLKVTIVPGLQLNLGDFVIKPFAVPHDSSENVGYEIRVGNVCFVIITDAGSITEECYEAIANANYLVIEANHDLEMLKGGPYPAYLKKRIASKSGHLSNEDCGKALAEHMSEHLRHVWLCHLSEENNHPELARKTVETILRSHGVIPGKDVELEVRMADAIDAIICTTHFKVSFFVIRF